jgi:hypothetical protein
VRSRGKRKGAVLGGTVLKSKPKSACGEGLGIEEGRVLVRRHLASNLGLLEDQHGLQDTGILEFEVVGKTLHVLGQGQGAELGLQFMKG